MSEPLTPDRRAGDPPTLPEVAEIRPTAGLTVSGRINGHRVFWDGAGWAYGDGQLIGNPRPCELPTPEGYDACVGYIEGATSFCCGHGVEPAHVVGSRTPGVLALLAAALSGAIVGGFLVWVLA